MVNQLLIEILKEGFVNNGKDSKLSTKELTVSEASRLIEDIEANKLKAGGEPALIEEFADCSDEIDLHQTAVTAYHLVNGICPNCGASQEAWRSEFGDEPCCEYQKGRVK